MNSVNVNKLRGKIITIVGNPAAGKTFLATKLADYYEAEIIHEQPKEGFPDSIKQNLETQTNLFETIIWFRNLQIRNYQQAIQLAASGKTVVMDTPFYHNQLFVSLYIQDPFIKDTLYSMGQIDRSYFKHPDCTIYIFTTPETAKAFLEKRKGTRIWENKQWISFITTMPPLVEEYMNLIKPEIPNFIEIKRHDFDFEAQDDLMKLINKINILF